MRKKRTKKVQAGVGRVDITPPVGIEMCGYAGRGDSTAVREPLTATVLLFEASGRPNVVVSLELLALHRDVTQRLRAKIAERLGTAKGTDKDSVIVVCTHTHYGPLTIDGFGPMSERVVEYLRTLEERVLVAVDAAHESLAPVRARCGRGTTKIGVNRRELTPDGNIVIGQSPDTPIDRDLWLVSLEREEDGEPIGMLVNAACHPTSQTNEMTEISGDYVGAMRKIVETKNNCPVLFLQGLCGNINPTVRNADYSSAERVGAQLAKEVGKAAKSLEEFSLSPVVFANSVLGLPARKARSRGAAQDEVAELSAILERCQEEDRSESEIAWYTLRHELATARLRSFETGIPLPNVLCDIQVLRLGTLAIATIQGELFNEIGVEIKEHSPFSQTLTVSYNGDWIGYIPTASAYEEGGYEVDEASRVAPRAAARIVGETLRLLQTLSDH